MQTHQIAAAFFCKNIFALIMGAVHLFVGTANAQETTFTGKVVNNTQQGLEGKKVEIYFNQGNGQQKYHGWTDNQGDFTINQYSTPVEQEKTLPTGYSISQNYPNPFNPKTNIDITLPKTSKIKIRTYNTLGEQIHNIEQELTTGTNKIPLNFNNNASGIYIAQIIIDDKYIQNKKMIMIHGTINNIQQTKKQQLQKNNTTTNIDSIVITGDAIKRKTFTGFPQYTTNNIDLGPLQVDSNYVNLILDVKKLMEWKQANNQLANALVNVSGQEKITDTNGQVNFITPSGRNTLKITHPQIYDRETILRLENDSTHTEYILDTLNYPQAYMDFYNYTFGRNSPGWSYQASQWAEPPIIYIVADTTTEPGRWRALQQIAKIDTVLKPAYTTPRYPEGFLKDVQIQIGTNPPAWQTPGYYIIEWVNIAPNGGLTGVKTDTTTGKILSANTQYNELLSHFEMEYLSIHELSTGISATGRSNALSSVWNLPVPSWDERNFTESDKKMILYQYTRPPGNKIIDKDKEY